MKLKEVVSIYIEAKVALTKCMQEHFKQLCHTCNYYGRCQVYHEYVEAWTQLQAASKALQPKVITCYDGDETAESSL